MILIAEPYARFDKTISSAQLELSAKQLLEFAEAEIISYYRKNGRGFLVEISVRIERGSTKSWIAVLTLSNALIFYGNIRQSIDYLIHDAKYVSELVLPSVPKQIGLGTEQAAVQQRRLGVPGQLNRLFQAVERQEMSADEATRLAVDVLYNNEEPTVVDAVPGLIVGLSDEILEASRSSSPLQSHRQVLGKILEVSRSSLPLQHHQQLPAPGPSPINIAHVVPAVRPRIGSVARRDESGNIKFSNY